MERTERDLGEAAGLLVALTEAMQVALDDPPAGATDADLVAFAIEQATSLGGPWDQLVSERAWQHAQRDSFKAVAFGVLDLVRMERKQP